MMEKDITISCRPADAAAVKEATAKAAKDFEKNAGYAVKIELDEELAAGSSVTLRLALHPVTDLSVSQVWRSVDCGIRQQDHR